MDDKTVMLVADDDSSYAPFVDLALKKAHADLTAIYVADGEEVIDYLQGVGKFADRNAFPLPDLIMLDQKMPGMSGLETLVWIRQHSQFKDLPVLVLTSYADPASLRRANELGANYYMVKPFTCDDLARALREFYDSAKLGPRDHPPGTMRTEL